MLAHPASRPVPTPTSRPRARRGGALARTTGLALVGLLVLAGCVAPKDQASEVPTGVGTSAPVPEDVDAALAQFYSQDVEWETCGEVECGSVEVPIDYAEPDGATMQVKIARRPASGSADDRLGSLLINPGGPGASGIGLLDSVDFLFSEEVLDAYDVVGFDPRGVGASSPITCLDDAAKDAFVSQYFDYSTDEGLAAARAAYVELGEACLDGTGELLGHVSTVEAAKDMDVLRGVLGDETLSYLGYSYGTQLGATYAGLFPTRAGRLVLDGALDPSLDADAVGVGQAVGFENALRAYVTSCQTNASACPLDGTVDEGLAQVRGLLDDARESPLRTNDDSRRLTATLGFYGIATPLYQSQAWPQLTLALSAAITKGDGTMLLMFADLYNDRADDGSFASNTFEAFTAIGCLDSRADADPAAMRAQADELERVAPTLGSFFGYGGIICEAWPVPQTGEPAPIAATGSAPILVIGTTGDPATPYEWSVSLAEQLDAGVLLTYKGEGHTAYGRSNSCVEDAVDDFLVEGVVPENGRTC